MAKADYICCSVCDEKLIYDAYDDISDAIIKILGKDPNDRYNYLVAICPKCSGIDELSFTTKRYEIATNTKEEQNQ